MSEEPRLPGAWEICLRSLQFTQEELEFLILRTEPWQYEAQQMTLTWAEVSMEDAPPLPGHLCEQCLDAPAVHLQPAPWGGEMGVCDDCATAQQP